METLFSFQGRLRRSEWWLTRLIVLGGMAAAIVVIVSLAGVAEFTGDDVTLDVLIGVAFVASFVVLLWIEVAAGVKRLHDQEYSGWLYLCILIPGVGALFALIVLGILEGTRGDNRYGPSSKYPGVSRAAAVMFE